MTWGHHRPSIEPLEPRRLLSRPPVAVDARHGYLIVRGRHDQPDVIDVGLAVPPGGGDALFTVTINGQPQTLSQPLAQTASPAARRVVRVVVRCGRRADVVRLSPAVTVPADIRGGRGDDELTGGGGPDLIVGGPGNDVLSGNGVVGSDPANGGQDRLLGGSGDDVLQETGTVGAVLDGGRGNDTLRGGDGPDTLLGGGGNDGLAGGGGDDVARGGKGDDQLFGQDGDDRLYGDRGNDVLDGGAGSDFLFGGHGRDALDGGEDADPDQLLGGAELDHVKSRAGDKLLDLTPGELV